MVHTRPQVTPGEASTPSLGRVAEPTSGALPGRALGRRLRVAVVVPARNEESQILKVLQSMPPLVSRIIVVDDASEDATARLVLQRGAEDPRVQLVKLASHRGVGGAIAMGYAEVLRGQEEVAVVMAGDGQMDPADLPALLLPLEEGRADYVKGSRFAYPGGSAMVPAVRRLGIRVLSAATRLAAGYDSLSDSQCGFTAISSAALAALDLDGIYPGYGYPNHLLGLLRAQGLRVAEVPVRPRYHVGERSKMRIHRVVLPITLLLFGILIRRLGAGPQSTTHGVEDPGARASPG